MYAPSPGTLLAEATGSQGAALRLTQAAGRA